MHLTLSPSQTIIKLLFISLQIHNLAFLKNWLRCCKIVKIIINIFSSFNYFSLENDKAKILEILGRVSEKKKLDKLKQKYKELYDKVRKITETQSYIVRNLVDGLTQTIRLRNLFVLLVDGMSAAPSLSNNEAAGSFDRLSFSLYQTGFNGRRQS